MRQGTADLYHWECSANAHINYQANSIVMDLNIKKMNSSKIAYQSSSESGVSSDQLVPVMHTNTNKNNLNISEHDSVQSRFNLSIVRGTRSKSSDTSLIDSVSSINSSEIDNNVTMDSDNNPTNTTKFDDIIEKIVELKFTPNNFNDKQNKTLNTNEKESSGKMNDNYEEKDVDNNENISDKNKLLKKKVFVIKKETKKENYEEEVAEDSNDEGDDDDDLRARGPVKSQLSQSRNKPYHTLNEWLESSAGMQSYTSDIDSTAQRILSNQKFSSVINPCLDRLEGYNKGQSYCSSNISNSEWHTMTNQDMRADHLKKAVTSTPSISSTTVNENSLTGEALLMEILDLKGFQGAQSDIENHANSSPTASSENWPDSPASVISYNNVLSSRSHSRASSRAQSPGSMTNVGSPHLQLNIIGSPPQISSGLQRTCVQTVLSSSSSSSNSFDGTSSPSSYRQSIDARVEDQLGIQFGNFSTWCEKCNLSETAVNVNVNATDEIDNSLKLLEEVIKNDLDNEEMQVVPKYLSQENNTTLWRCRMRNHILARQHSEANLQINQINMKSSSPPLKSMSPSANQTQTSNLGNTASIISSAQIDLVYPEFNYVYDTPSYQKNTSQQNFFNQKSPNSMENMMNIESEMVNLLSTNYLQNNDSNNQFYVNHRQPQILQQAQQLQLMNTMNEGTLNYNDFSPQSLENASTHSMQQSSSSHGQQNAYNSSWSEQQQQPQQSQQQQYTTIFKDFQIPKTVSQFRYTHCKRNVDRHIPPWSSLNLPMTSASRRLKNELNPKDVEKAMKNLLKKSTTELAKADEDGDTLLMCLVGNPVELQNKKAYLVPLVERLGILSDGLSKFNNRGEDALYLAAMNCFKMPHVTGYLGAVMVQKGIDMSQRLYQTRGDTLIHAVAANGDTHLAVLTELLSLKTRQGNPVFDLSKCNYDGRTPLHIAVEAHDPLGLGIKSIRTVRLLLESGADPKIKEIKCGNTALHLAVSLCCDPALVEILLIRNGHEVVNIPNTNNNTPLHIVAAASDRIPLDMQIDVCIHLIKAGGLTNIQNHQGKIPLALVSDERKDCIKNIFRNKS